MVWAGLSRPRGRPRDRGHSAVPLSTHCA